MARWNLGGKVTPHAQSRHMAFDERLGITHEGVMPRVAEGGLQH